MLSIDTLQFEALGSLTLPDVTFKNELAKYAVGVKLFLILELCHFGIIGLLENRLVTRSVLV